MANFQAEQGNKMTPKKRAWIAISVLLCLALLLGKATWNIYAKNRLARENKEATLRQLRDLEERKSRLEIKLTNLKTSEGVEEEIRRSFPVAKEGEKVIMIVDEKAAEEKAEAPATSTARARLWQALFRAGTED